MSLKSVFGLFGLPGCSLMLAATLSFPLNALADHHEDHAPAQIECRCEKGENPHGEHHEDHHEYEEHHGRHAQAFEEGTPNIFPADTVPADHLYLVYSHNFFWVSVPRSSNPAFWAKYSPIEHFQVDVLTTLRSPFELEGGLSYQVLDEGEGDLLSLTPRLSFNTRGNVFGGEVTASRYILDDIWQVGADVRIISNASADEFDRPVAAAGLNTMVRVWKDWHVFGDVAVPFDGEILQKRSVLWSAGIKKKIPGPHVLTLYVGNTQEQSLTGRTVSPGANLEDFLRVGFIFSIDIPSLTELPGRLF